MLPDFKMVKVTVTMLSWDKDSRIDQENGIKSLEIKLHLHGQMIFHKGTMTIQQGKDGLLYKWLRGEGSTGNQRTMKMNLKILWRKKTNQQ